MAQGRQPSGAITASGCGFVGDVRLESAMPRSFASVDEARSLVQRISSAVGLEPNFEVLEYDVPNAAAVIHENRRYILYNASFLAQITQATATEWSAWTITAHEVGHHLNGHTLTRGGSRPPTELEADRFAGHVVRRLGGTLEQALAAYRQVPVAGSDTHPARDQRLDAVTRGWNSAQGPGAAPGPTPGPAPGPDPGPGRGGVDINCIIRGC